MAENIPFNYNLDKITEREVVPDFVTRLTIGNDLINPDDNDKVIIPAKAKLKDVVLMNMIRTFDISDIEYLDSIKTTYKKVRIGSTAVIIDIPEGYTCYRIIQEKTGQDVTNCFNLLDDGTYKAEFDVPATNDDIYKAYFYDANIIPV